jgi:Taurine catabolism dioxygenase TauD, TfdA family
MSTALNFLLTETPPSRDADSMARISMDDLPQEIRGPSAWYGPDLAASGDWIEHLTETEVLEIDAATERLANAEIDIPSIRQTDFPLPMLGARLRWMLEHVLTGRGFVLLRRLPVERWSVRKTAIAYFGLGAHLGSARSQNAQGHVLGHVKDLGLSSSDPNVRIYQTSERQGYHTDSCDVVGLLCLQPAKAGGLSSLVSSVTIFNEMRRRRSDLVPCLFEPIETDRRGEVPEGHKPYFQIPVFNWYAGLLSTIYQRKYIDSARRFVKTPLTPQQQEALDLFDALADDPALNLSMKLLSGDVQLVHNRTLLHDRTAFEDWPEPERKRHLLRLWLAPPEARPLPPVFAERYGSLMPGDRGGVIVKGVRQTAPLA